MQFPSIKARRAAAVAAFDLLLVTDRQETYLSRMTKADGYRLIPIGDET